MRHKGTSLIVLMEIPARSRTARADGVRGEAPNDQMRAYHARQYSANRSSSLGAKPMGVVDLMRALGGGVGRPFLDWDRNEGDVGERMRPETDRGLVGGEGRS